MNIKIQIKSIFGKVLFEFEKENNTVKDTVLEAIEQSANLRSADLRSADLRSVNLRSADLRSADLRYADLRYADLQYADLQYADLRSADLRYADLRSADLQYADLRSADLQYANLRSADLRSADLRSADLRSANLQSANLQYANLRSADLKKIYTINTILPEGELIVWKKLQSGLIAKCLVSVKAKRVNAIGSRKCRFEFVKTIAIFDDKKKVKEGIGNHDNKTLYKVGELTYPDEFDPSPLIECSHGIHAFITKQEAIDY